MGRERVRNEPEWAEIHVKKSKRKKFSIRKEQLELKTIDEIIIKPSKAEKNKINKNKNPKKKDL